MKTLYQTVCTIVLCFATIKCEDPRMLFYGMEPCSESKIVDAIEVTHDWSQGLFSGTINMPEGLDDTIRYEAVLYRSKNGNWKEVTKIAGSVCAILNGSFKGIWSKITESAGVQSDCPIPGGSYKLTDFSISAEDAELPALQGKFKVVAEVYKQDTPLLCREILIQSTNYKETV